MVMAKGVQSAERPRSALAKRERGSSGTSGPQRRTRELSPTLADEAVVIADETKHDAEMTFAELLAQISDHKISMAMKPVAEQKPAPFIPRVAQVAVTRPASANAAGDGRPASAGSRAGAAGGSAGRHFYPTSSPTTYLFDSQVGYLECRPDLSRWDQARIGTIPRAWPSVAETNVHAAIFHDDNFHRAATPGWRPTSHNKKTGPDGKTAQAFPYKRPCKSRRPRPPAAKGPLPIAPFDPLLSYKPRLHLDKSQAFEDSDSLPSSARGDMRWR
eukprot:TRINITY_DN33906_c0_g1_i1.p1 TRINITY_DN33906_c0_g1~~TRINITY_DN33906_c0_g1_i1.p1  ORF type:complete len:298 (-),score=33.64 TRINITY_DN33906_c0_g1_i1:569-1387(-)